MANHLLTRQRMALLVALLTLVASIYMLTYSARIESTDTLFMFDATTSLVRFGDMQLDLTAGERRYWAYDQPTDDFPLLRVDAEPLQIVLAAPLYWLADNLPGIGRVHAVWLFNIVVTTLTVGVFYLYTLQLGYDERIALIGALLLGLCTITWAYSKTFFQEPLTTLLILLSAFWVERWRRFRQWTLLPMIAITFAFAIIARRASLMALPVLTIIAFPWLDALFHRVWVRKGLLLFIVVMSLVLYYQTIPHSAQTLSHFLNDPESLTWDQRIARATINQGIHNPLFTLGGGILGTSPILWLSILGIGMLARQNHMRYPLAALTLLLTYTLVYALASGGNWFGGVSWPPRFLVPTVPFLMLCALSALQWLLSDKAPRWAKVSAALLVIYSVWVQFNAVSYWWGDYADVLPLEANQFLEWRGGFDDVRYFRWVLLPQLWGIKPLDFAWVRTKTPLFPVTFSVTGVISGVMIVVILSRNSILSSTLLKVPSLRAGRGFRGGVNAFSLIPFLPLLWLVSVGVGLRLIYTDDLYLAFSDGLKASVPVIQSELNADDLLLISQLGYGRFYLNYGNISEPRIISLPEHPGEQPSPEQPPLITSSNPADLLEKPTIQFLQTITQTHERLWLLSHSSPYITWSVRPLERYMAMHYYPLRTLDLSGADGLPVRLIEYSTAAYHEPLTLIGAEHPTDLRYGDHLQLVGYTLPLGETYTAGETLPVSLYWVADQPIDDNLTVSMHLASVEGSIAASGEDSQPYNGFAPTSTWGTNQPVWDNRALRLPDVPGTYEIWVGVYRFNAAGEVELLPVTGSKTAEGDTLGVLPTVIQLTSRGDG